MFPDHSHAEADTLIVHTYSDTSFTTLLSEQQYANVDSVHYNLYPQLNFATDTTLAYILYLPSIEDTYRIAHISLPQRYDAVICNGKLTGNCTNYIAHVQVTRNGQPVEYKQWTQEQWLHSLVLFKD